MRWIESGDPWGAFRNELKRYMAERSVSAPELARMLSGEVSDDTVNNWRKGASRPRLELLPKISKALGMGASEGGEDDPTYLLTRMGLIPKFDPEEAHAVAYRIHKLDIRYRESLERNAQGARDYGVAVIMAAARESQQWAVGVWPAIEGPAECRMHVADRVDLRPLDQSSVVDRDPWEDPMMHAALREAFAVPSPRQPRWTSGPPEASCWSISHVGAPMSPWRRRSHEKIPSVLCYGLTLDSWVNDVASLLATSLGYGLSTTRDLAMEATGITAGVITPSSRSQAHRTFMTAPPSRRVWSHHAPLDSIVPDPFDIASENIPIIWLRESSDLLARYATRTGVLSLELLIEARDRLDELASNNPRVIIIETDNRLSSDDRWLQVLESVAAVFRTFERAGLLDDDARSHWPSIARSDTGVGAPLIAWMQKVVGPA